MRKVAEAIMSRVKASTFWRPIRSPNWPSTTPPRGRAMKVTAKTPRENRFWAVVDPPGRNILPMITAR